MTGVIATLPKFQFSDALGLPMSGGTLTSYLAGTTTPATTYQDEALSAANTNPIALDSRGECTLWLDSTKTYKFVLKNALGVVQWTVDNITNSTAFAQAVRVELTAYKDALVAPSGSSLIGYQPQAYGASPTTIEAKLRESVSVLDFYANGVGGARVDPTGVIDSYLGIQAAIDYAADVFGEVILPRGAYRISASLNLKTTVSLKGAGQDSSEIRYYGVGGTALKLEGEISDQLTKVNLRDFSVYDYGTGVNGINMVQCHYSTLSNMRVYGFTVGISVQHCWNDLFTFVTADGNSQDGFNFTTTDANAIQLIGCQGLANGRAGLYTEGGRAVIAVGSTFEANGQYGVYLSCGAANRPLNYTFTGCYIEGNGTYEVYCDSTTAYDPRGIIFRDCYFEAIAAKATIAIRVVDSLGFIVDGCTFDNQGVSYAYSLYADAAGAAQGIVWGRNVDSSTNGVYMEVAYSDVTKNETFASGRFVIDAGVVISANSYNISTITIISAGVYEVTLKKAARGAAYVIHTSCENGAAYAGMLCNPGQPISSTVFRIYTSTDASTLADARTVNFSVFNV